MRRMGGDGRGLWIKRTKGGTTHDEGEKEQLREK